MRNILILSSVVASLGLASGVQADTSVGLGLALVPQFEGSSDYKALALPNFAFKSDKFSVRTNKLGLEADIFASRAFDAGPIVRYNLGRKGSGIDNVQVSALPDIGGGLELGGFAQLNFPIGGTKTFLAPRVAVIQGVNGGATGMIAEGSLDITRLQGDWVFGGSLSTTYANSEYMNSFFSVGAASPSGLAAFSAGAGFKDVGVSVFANYKINDRLSLTGIAGYKVLLGDAAASPIVSVAGEKNQMFLALGVSYAFN